MNPAYVTPQLVKWARERAGMSVGQLADMLRIDSRTLSAWEVGEQKPPFGRAEKLAETLRVPFGYLFLSKPPADDLPIPDLRTVGTSAIRKPSLNFIDVINDSVLKQEWYSEYIQENGGAEVSVVGSCRIADGIKSVASKMSDALDINESARAQTTGWEEFLSYIVKAAEALGILVMQRGIVGNNTKRLLDVSEFRGFAIVDKFAPLVFINARDAKAAKNFTIIHELCHVWLGASGISNPDLKSRTATEKNTIERFCNNVAAEVLAPKAQLTSLWSSAKTIDRNIAELARHFRVSRYVIARQANESDRITLAEYLEYLDRHPWFLKAAEIKGEGGNFYNTLGARNGKRFIGGVLTALGQNAITFRDASTLLGVKVTVLKRIAERFA
jgi:Zn-dependent peptidase ImmA (M78 family)/transcriptional regulator with XRE-family HTH domain